MTPLLLRRTHAPLLALALGVTSASAAASDDDSPMYESTIKASSDDPMLPEERAASRVQASDLARRQPRSAPDALRYEPGVFVQQSGHGQGSAFLRGLTGQQTLLMFDGVRLNNSTYRQGPNQYFFTLDSRTIDSIDVLRGGGSTRFGSDALGGVINARPIEPAGLDTATGLHLDPRLFVRATTADSERGGRAQINVTWARRDGAVRLGFVGGIGGRRIGQLEGRPVLNPRDGMFPPVPRYEGYSSIADPRTLTDLRVQRGTGFDELTADGRLVVGIGTDHRLTAAAYLYRQYDAPRTDQCPPPTGASGTCLTYEEQFRHLAYLAWDARLGRAAKRARLLLSYQQQHERRRLDYPLSMIRNLGLDDVDTIGIAAHAETSALRPRPWVKLEVSYGVDTYYDRIRSAASVTFTDTGSGSRASRGQYLDGSTYLHGGAFLDGEAYLGRFVALRGGGRVSWLRAHAPGDAASGSQPVDRTWFPVVGHLGIDIKPATVLSLLANVDHSFRAPNLDDLTGRQQTGPGFQFENPNLNPERMTTFEVGARLRTPRLTADAWAFETLVTDAIVKQSQSRCPPDTPQCDQAGTRLALFNAPGLAELRGVEGAVKALLPGRVTARATIAYTWGETANTNPGNTLKCPTVTVAERVPYTRIPPLNGTVELHWTHRLGFGAGAALRWAGKQDRLANADCSDARIPLGGTPGFAVVDLRASYRVGDRLSVAATLENLLDSPYRYHGSSVNGAGRGFVLQIEAAPF